MRISVPNPAVALLGLVRAYLTSLPVNPAAEFVAGIDWRMQERALPAKGLPCLRHLAGIGTHASPAERPLLNFLEAQASGLHWGQTYSAADFGLSFIDNYGWVELFGTRGHFINETMASGLLILGPDIVYPDHHHTAEELYVPLTGGTLWRKGQGGFVERRAGEVIHHPSDVSHAMRTGGRPLVALYLWRGGPLAQKSTIGPNGT